MTNSGVDGRFDVAVIGGGPAGLSAAIALGRSRRSVVVLDAGRPRNAAAEGVHNFLTRDGTPPAELLAAGRDELAQYGGIAIGSEVVSARRVGTELRLGFELGLDDGRTVRARRLLVTTGLHDELPDVLGLAEQWGHDVLHCPYCHGWEVRDRAVGVLATGPMATHQVMLFRQLTADVVLFTHTAPPLTGEQREQLAARDVGIVEGAVERVETSEGRLTGVRLRDGRVVAREALVVAPRMAAHSAVLEDLGVKPVAHPLGAEVGEAYPCEPGGAAPDAPGVWLAGNVTDLQAQVITAAAQGLLAVAMINASLIEDDTRRAVEAWRAR